MSAFSLELVTEFDKVVGKTKDMMATYRRGLGTVEEANRNALYTRIEALMSEEEDIYKQLELEVRGGGPSAKTAFAERKDTHNTLKSEFVNIKSDHQRALLLATGGDAEKSAYRDAQKEKLEASQRKYVYFFSSVFIILHDAITHLVCYMVVSTG